MKSSIAAIGVLAASAFASPLASRQSSNIDPVVLQFALTLEHLENTFYRDALKRFTQADFQAAGYSATYYNNLKQISFDEQSHVQLLSGALTAANYTPVQPCTYNFPYTDVKSFVTLSSILEGVGTSAYLGGAPLITSKSYLTVAGSILVAEALHTSMQRSAIGEVPFANPYGTPLDPTAVYTLAAMFIKSCPASNPALPFTAFPTLTYAPNPACYCEEPDCSPNAAMRHSAPKNQNHEWQQWGSGSKPAPAAGCAPPSANAQITLTAASDIPANSYVTFVSGLSIVSVQGTISGKSVMVAIPASAAGQTYAFISKTNQTGTFVDANVLFGPAIVEVNPPPVTIN